MISDCCNKQATCEISTGKNGHLNFIRLENQNFCNLDRRQRVIKIFSINLDISLCDIVKKIEGKLWRCFCCAEKKRLLN